MFVCKLIILFFFLYHLCLEAQGMPRSISSSLSHCLQSLTIQSLPSHFFLLFPQSYLYKFFLVFLQFLFSLVVLSLSALASYPFPQVPYVQTVLTFSFLIFLQYGIVLIYLNFFHSSRYFASLSNYSSIALHFLPTLSV